eukprot:gene1505-1897_t
MESENNNNNNNNNNSNKTLPYKWTQTLKDVTVTIECDAPVRGRDLFVKFDNDHLIVKNKTLNKVYIDGPLSKNVKKSDCIWQVGM